MYAVGQVSLPGEGFLHVPLQEPGFSAIVLWHVLLIK